MDEVRRRALLASDNKPEYVRALRESPTWYRFGDDTIGYWKNAGYRYDFYTNPRVPDLHGRTVVCPECGIDAVIRDASEIPIRKDVLEALYEYMFN